MYAKRLPRSYHAGRALLGLAVALAFTAVAGAAMYADVPQRLVGEGHMIAAWALALWDSP
jgi:hypothetical protein